MSNVSKHLKPVTHQNPEPPNVGGSRVIHFHPSLRCNLKCKHCYSSSSPHGSGAVSIEEIKTFLDYAVSYQYDTLSISGGEPFLYADLASVLKTSRGLGMRNLVASNGTLFKRKRNQEILSLIDVIAISIDGNEQIHDQIRSQPGSFQKMVEGLKILQQHQKPFGLIHTITADSWKQLPWLAEWAYGQGATLLQLHPLEIYGRANSFFKNGTITQEILHRVFIMGSYFRAKYYPKMAIQMDFLHQDHIMAHPETVGYFGSDYIIDQTTFSKVLSTIIVDEQGDIYPLSYGFSKQYKIGHLRELTQGIDIFERFQNVVAQPLYRLLENTYKTITSAEQEDEFFPWTELIVKRSHAATSP